MKLLPQTLLGRTALLIAALLIVSEVSSNILFNFYYSNLRAQRMADLVIANLNSIGAALETLPAELQQTYLTRLQREQDLRVLPGASPPLAQAPHKDTLRAVHTILSQHYGDAFRLSLKDQHDPVFWVSVTAAPQSYWVGVPLNRIERGFRWPRIWPVVGGLLALLGAYLVVRRINRPLYQLTQAAQAIGQGKSPPPLAETGPSEIRAVCGAFNQMARDVQQLDKDRNLLLAGVSHDLRTPLARLRLAVELLENNRDPVLQQDMIHDIEHMDGIISQFLAFVRHGADEAARPGDLNHLLQELSERYAAPDKKITLLLDELPVIHFKPLAMQRLLGNLIDNALRHGSPDIEIHTQAAANSAIVKILDRGPGIPEHERHAMMQPFTQAARDHDEKGAGLGLAIVDKIARLHNGKIALLDRAGGGLEARLELPLG